jgi:O-antigen/teichoic acid export membrane protein
LELFKSLSSSVFYNIKKKDIGFSTLSTIVVGIAGYLFHFIVSRKLSVSEYGILLTLFSLLSFMSILNSIWSNFVLRVSSNHGDENASYSFLYNLYPKFTIFVLISSLIIYLFLWMFIDKINLPNEISIYALMLAYISWIVGSLLNNFLLGLKKFTLVYTSSILTELTKLISGFLLSYFFVLGEMVFFSVGIAHLIQIIVLSKGSGINFKNLVMRKISFNILDFKIPYRTIYSSLSIGIFSFLLGNLEIILVNQKFSNEEAGFYGAYSLIGKLSFYFNSAIMTVFLPNILNQNFNSNLIHRILVCFMLLEGFCFSILCFFGSEHILHIFFGDKYINSTFLWVFPWVGTFYSILSLQAFISYGKESLKDMYLVIFSLLICVKLASSYSKSIQEFTFSILLFFAIISFSYFFWNEWTTRKKSFQI